MGKLKIVVRIFCLLPFLTGTLDLVMGVGMLQRAGVPIPDKLARDPGLNNQIGFWGAIWLGFGVILWRSTPNLRANSRLFRLLMGILFLSGLGRALATIRFGRPGGVLIASMGVELLGGPILLLWHQRALRSGSAS